MASQFSITAGPLCSPELSCDHSNEIHYGRYPDIIRLISQKIDPKSERFIQSSFNAVGWDMLVALFASHYRSNEPQSNPRIRMREEWHRLAQDGTLWRGL